MLIPLLLLPAHAATLEDAWAAAESGGTELRLVKEERVQAETLKTQAWALVSPKLVAKAEYTINEYPIEIDFSEMIPEEFADFIDAGEPIVVNKERFFAWNASVVQPLFSGQALPLMNAATQTVKASRAQEQAARAQIRSGIAQAYYGVVVAREGAQLAERALEHARAHAKLAKQQVDVGLAPPTAGLQAEIAVARAERERANAEQGKVRAEEALARLTGWSVDTPVSLPDARPLPYADRESAEERAISNRPEIAVAAHQARAAQNGLTAAHLAWMPSVDGRFTWSYSENTGFSDDKDMWQIGIAANWLIWDGGARIADQAKQASIRRMAVLAEERVRDTTLEEVRGAWEAYDAARAALTAVDRELSLAKENLRLAEVGFKAGSLAFLEVEDARVGLLAAELGALQTRAQRDLAVLTLLAATGDL
jgi:multidrug efflux system outer membrane protein